MKFKLQMENGDVKVIHEFETYGLDEFNEHTKDFLRGCGYIIKEEEEQND